MTGLFLPLVSGCVCGLIGNVVQKNEPPTASTETKSEIIPIVRELRPDPEPELDNFDQFAERSPRAALISLIEENLPSDLKDSCLAGVANSGLVPELWALIPQNDTKNKLAELWATRTTAWHSSILKQDPHFIPEAQAHVAAILASPATVGFSPNQFPPDQLKYFFLTADEERLEDYMNASHGALLPAQLKSSSEARELQRRLYLFVGEDTMPGLDVRLFSAEAGHSYVAETDATIKDLILKWAESCNDPDQFSVLLSSLEAEKTEVLNRLFMQWAILDPTAAVAALKRYPGIKQHSINSAFEHLASIYPALVPVLLEANVDIDSRRSLLRGWVRVSPKNASNYISGISRGSLRDIGASAIFSSQVRHDPEAAVAWLGLIEQSDERREAVEWAEREFKLRIGGNLTEYLRRMENGANTAKQIDALKNATND